MHYIWPLPDHDDDFANRWLLIKKNLSRQMPRTETINASRKHKGERAIWQRRYWEHLIQDERNLKTHVDYTHYNPVKHGYAQSPAQWPFSNIQRFIR